MRAKPVHWSEGMLVLPHHFQAADAALRDEMAALLDWREPYSYGLRRFEWTREALANFELRVTKLHVRLKNGLVVAYPENAHLSHLDLRPQFTEHQELYVFLAVPETVEGRSNATRRKSDDSARVVVEPEDWADRNAAGNPRPIETELLNARLVALPSLDGPKGFEAVPILKLKRSAQEDALPEVDDEYIPPLLSCDAWPFLKEDVLAAVVSRLGAFGQAQADFLQTHGGWREANQEQIRKAIFQLNAVNTAYPCLRQLTEAQGVHPFVAYCELTRLVGSLSLFRDSWKPVDLLLYDHDDLGRIFRAISADIKFEYDEAKVRRFPFVGVGEWMEVALEPEWLRNRNLGFYIGVRSDLTPERLERFFTSSPNNPTAQRFLEAKLGSARTITQIFRNREAGLGMTRVVGVHQSLPALKDYTYFEVDARGYYWEQVAESRTLALKFNENWIRGSYVGQSILPTVDPRGNPHDLKLELFLVNNE